MILGTANITKSTIYVKLSEQYAQLHAIDRQTQQESTIKSKQDYIETTNGNLDKNDYERVLEKFKSTDANIRAHEQNHAASSATTAPIQYNYQTGPDGKMYAVGGSVRLDTSVPNDPKEAQFKLDKIAKSASANSDASGADAMITSQANLMKMRLTIQSKEQNI